MKFGLAQKLCVDQACPCRDGDGEFTTDDLGIKFYPMKRTWKDDEIARTDTKSLEQALNSFLVVAAPVYTNACNAT